MHPTSVPQVERLLGSVDAVLYVLDYTKLKTCEEAAMFKRLHQVNPGLVRRLAQRLFFVVNKVRTGWGGAGGVGVGCGK
jgi:hypothetical protein